MPYHPKARELVSFLAQLRLVDPDQPPEEVLEALEEDVPPGPDALARVCLYHQHWRAPNAADEHVLLDIAAEDYLWFSSFNEALASEPFRFVRSEPPPEGHWRYSWERQYARVLREPMFDCFPELLDDPDSACPYVDDDADVNIFYGEPPSDPTEHDAELDRLYDLNRLDGADAVGRLGDLGFEALVKLAHYIDIELQGARSRRRLYGLGSRTFDVDNAFFTLTFLLTTPAVAEEIARRGFPIRAASDADDDWYEAHPIGFHDA